MIRTLRIRFVALTMGLLLALLAVIFAAINLLNYRSVLTDCDGILALLTENDGKFPPMDEPFEHGGEPPFSRELPYETRYFTVLLNNDGAVVLADTGRIAVVDTSAAVDYAQRVFASGKTRGFLDDYRFSVRRDPKGSLIVFLDCGRRLADVRSFLAISGAISLLGYLVVFALTVFFSGRIVKPFLDNYEKQKRFITDAGHELKTPLTIINADVDVLALETGENEWLQDIRTQSDRLAVLTNALVYLARMEEPQPDVQAIDFPLSDVVEETAHSFQALALARGQTLRLQIQPLLSLCGQEAALRQLTSILLDNALKYAPEGSEITLCLTRAGHSIRLSVTNPAAPMSSEERKHLFDRFYRTDTSRSTQTGGYGIGLSIARAIVAAHRGTISATAPEEHLLCITATFPA